MSLVGGVLISVGDTIRINNGTIRRLGCKSAITNFPVNASALQLPVNPLPPITSNLQPSPSS